MRIRHSTEAISSHEEATITALAAEQGVREVWLFGSAVTSNGEAEPNDIDIALLGVPSSANDTLATCLQRCFSGCRTDDALDYRASMLSGPSSSQMPFVIADDGRDFWSHPISRSIRKGVCLSRSA